MPALSRLVRVFTLASAVVLAGGLTACADTTMPTGYTYHNEVYKAPPGKEASKPAHVVGQGTAPAMVVDQAPVQQTEGLPPGFTNADIDSLTVVAEDLLAKLVRNFGRPMEPTMVITHPANTNRDAAMEMALRRAMQNQGIPVSTAAGEGPFSLGYAIADRAQNGAGAYTLDAEIFLVVQGQEITRQHGSVDVSAAPVYMNNPPVPVADVSSDPIVVDSGF